jgi:hypothetical protein
MGRRAKNGRSDINADPASSLSSVCSSLPKEMALTVLSSAVDKPKILFYCAMMAIQNYGFHAMYCSATGD